MSDIKHEIDKQTKDLLAKSELSNEFEKLVRQISPALPYFSKQKKLLNMLSSEPKSNNQRLKDQWQRLGPMQIASIVLKSDEDYLFDPYKVELEYKTIDFGNYVYEGFVKEGTETFHGIGRMILS